MPYVATGLALCYLNHVQFDMTRYVFSPLLSSEILWLKSGFRLLHFSNEQISYSKTSRLSFLIINHL
jgi:hypothetical protein